jgi:hypothetical protein
MGRLHPDTCSSYDQVNCDYESVCTKTITNRCNFGDSEIHETAGEQARRRRSMFKIVPKNKQKLGTMYLTSNVESQLLHPHEFICCVR